MNTHRFERPEQLAAYREQLASERNAGATVINVCAGTGCQACGCQKVIEALQAKVAQSHLEKVVQIKATGCPGPCEWGPLMTIFPEKIFYVRVTPKDTALIVDQTIKAGRLVDKLVYRDPVSGKAYPLLPLAVAPTGF